MADDNGYEQQGRTPSPRRESAREEPPRNGGGYGGQDNYGGGRAPIDVNPGNNLHVAGLAVKTRETDLEEIFGKFGKIEKVQIMRDPHSKDSRGFGFVTFEVNDDADAAMSALNNTTLDERTITVEKARRGRARTPTPGQYRGPPKREERYGSGPPRRYDDRGPPRGGRYDDYRGPPPRDYYGGGGGGGYAAPMRGGGDYSDGRRDAYNDRRYDDRRGGDRDYGRRDERDYDRRGPPPMDDRRRDYPPRGGYDDYSRRY